MYNWTLCTAGLSKSYVIFHCQWFSGEFCSCDYLFLSWSSDIKNQEKFPMLPHPHPPPTPPHTALLPSPTMYYVVPCLMQSRGRLVEVALYPSSETAHMGPNSRPQHPPTSISSSFSSDSSAAYSLPISQTAYSLLSYLLPHLAFLCLVLLSSPSFFRSGLFSFAAFICLQNRSYCSGR